MVRLSSLLPVIACFFASSCEEHEMINPKANTLGKWELVEQGNWPNMHPTKPSGFTEFREDSVMLFFDYKANAYTAQSTYWVTDSLLTERVTRPDGKHLYIRQSYVMRKSWLRLDFIDLIAMNQTAVFRRIH